MSDFTRKVLTTNLLSILLILLKITTMCRGMNHNINYNNNDEYLSEASRSCERTRDFVECAKVRVLKYVSAYTVPINTNNSFINLVKINDNDGENEKNANSSSSARFIAFDSEPVKFLKYLQRQAKYFFNHQGLSIPIPDGALFVDSETGEELVKPENSLKTLKNESFGKMEVGRRKKLPKHANMLIPILILFKVFKVKVLVALVLAGIFFIKKVIIVGAMVLPSLLHSVKTACKYHFTPHHHDHESYVSSFGGDYGGYYGGDHSGKGAWADRFYHNRPNNQQ